MSVRVLHLAAEAFPLIKTGGLADVAAALPAAQRALGADAQLLIPAYPAVLDALAAAGSPVTRLCDVGPVFGAARVGLLRAEMPGSGLPMLLAHAPWYFDRPGNPYVDGHGLLWADSHQRFALFGWLGAQIAAGGLLPDWQPQVVHAHDWHAGLALAWLAERPGPSPRRVFTIHNLAFQGRFPVPAINVLQLPAHWMQADRFEFHGDLSFIKAGINGAHCITTVSPTYAREILTPANGHGLDGLLRHRAARLSGILNGIDTALWNPQTDPAIESNYDADRLAPKARCRSRLRKALGLRQGRLPLLCLISRLSEQKGIGLVVRHLDRLVAQGFQLLALGTGERDLEDGMRAAALAHPDAVHFVNRFDEALAHRFIAAADAILIPSEFEPCGLTQLYGMRYGTVPLVRRVGGLADTVIDANLPDVSEATGFVFDHPGQFWITLERMASLWNDPLRWKQLMVNGMQKDHGWSNAAQRYLDLYDQPLAEQAPG